MKKIIVFGFIIACIPAVQAQSFRTQVFENSIRTLEIRVAGDEFAPPFFVLGSNGVLTVSFDELSHEAHQYRYRVLHCNADWTPSSLMTSEFASGFSQGDITDKELSVSTLVNYTHYQLQIPNSELQFRVSGNYVLQIYEDNSLQPFAQVCFSVVEPKVKISGRVRGNTDIELNGSRQQLDFEVNISGYPVRDPHNEIKVLVRQNERIDNQAVNLKPTYFSSSSLQYINNRALIFEGGNEYHRFDISSLYKASYGLNSVHYDGEINHAFLTPYTQPHYYSYEPDMNGKFKIHFQEAFNKSETEADYVQTHFIFETKEPFLDGNVYIGGNFNYNLIDERVKMEYDLESRAYHATTMLKQGGYNYQYLFVPKNQQVATTSRTDGSFWQTKNEYTIYVYHRGFGERYDKLIGVKMIESQ